MKTPVAFLLSLFLVISAAAEEDHLRKIDKFNLIDGQEFENVTVTKCGPEGVVIKHRRGTEKLTFRQISDESAIALGAFDPFGEKSEESNFMQAQNEIKRPPAKQPGQTPEDYHRALLSTASSYGNSAKRWWIAYDRAVQTVEKQAKAGANARPGNIAAVRARSLALAYNIAAARYTVAAADFLKKPKEK